MELTRTAVSASTAMLMDERPWPGRMLAGSAGWLGGFIMCWGVLFSLYGIFPGQNDFFKDVGMVIALFGVVLLLSSWAVMRVAWFPILFLFCGIPWPDQVYSWVAMPLQHLAAAVAVRFLTICNIASNVVGTKIVMHVDPGKPPRILDVEEACAGLRSLMTFVTLAGGWAFVFMSSRPLWHRLIQTASAVPIAIFCNVLRVSCTGLTDKWWGHEFSEGFAHRFVGLLLLVPAFFLILLVGWVLDNLFIEVADDEEAVAADQPGRVSAKAGNKVVVPNRSVVVAAAGPALGLPPVSVPAAGPAAVSLSNPLDPSKGLQKTARSSPAASTGSKGTRQGSSPKAGSPPAGPGQAPARNPAAGGFRPPVVRPPGRPAQAEAPPATGSTGSTGSTSSSQASSPRPSPGSARPRPAGPRNGPAAPSSSSGQAPNSPARPRQPNPQNRPRRASPPTSRPVSRVRIRRVCERSSTAIPT